LAAQGFLAAQGLAAHGFLPAQGFLAAQGFAAQGFLAAHGFAAQGFLAANSIACDGLADRFSAEAPLNGAIVTRLAIIATVNGLFVKRNFLWRALIK
jgi:hypothetical protein